MGVVTGHVQQYAAPAILGTAVIIPLGYTYVGLAALLRMILGPKAA